MSLFKQARLNLESLDDRTVPAVLDLTAAGSFGTLNDAIVHHMDATWASANGDLSHGTGPLQVVLGVNHTGTETGYNTTATPLQTGMDTTVAQALTLSQVPVVTVNGNQYYEFVLNVNEPTSANARKLSVDGLQFFVSDVSNLTNYNANKNTLGTLANKVSPVYDLDAGDPTNSLLLRAKTNTGAVGEIAFLVPVGNFASATPSSFVYIYTKITGAAGGDEQWGVRSAPVTDSGPASLSGQIYFDTNSNGTYEAGADMALAGNFMVTLSGPNGDTPMTTSSDGSFSFTGLEAGMYQISIMDTDAYLGHAGIIGTGNGVNDGELAGDGIVVLNIELSAGENGGGYGFLMVPAQGG